MKVRTFLWIISVLPVLAAPAAAQRGQLHGLPQSGNSLLPSAQQQLNRNLTRQKTDFSVKRQIDQANRRNRAEQIHRFNAERDRVTDPCAGAKSPCKIDD